MNRADALDRLVALVARAAEPPKRRRLDAKRRHGAVKRLRDRAGDDD